MAHDEGQEDPQLGAKRQGLTRTAGRRLADIGMIRFDEVENSLVITDLGRIAAKYYLKHETVEIFSKTRPVHVILQRTRADYDDSNDQINTSDPR
jgi:antiviral helicase SLH1